jgi:hypothetical protein
MNIDELEFEMTRAIKFKISNLKKSHPVLDRVSWNETREECLNDLLKFFNKLIKEYKEE